MIDIEFEKDEKMGDSHKMLEAGIAYPQIRIKGVKQKENNYVEIKELEFLGNKLCLLSFYKENFHF